MSNLTRWDVAVGVFQGMLMFALFPVFLAAVFFIVVMLLGGIGSAIQSIK
jgi:hypothetical protein